MGQDPAAIRQEIEHTRGEMGETMEAIGYKSDVKSRAGDFVSEQKDKVTGKVSSAKDTVTSTVTRVVPSREGIKRQTRRVSKTAESNPVGLTVGAAAVGFLVGMLVPSTRVEDERVGEIADRVKDQASDVGHEALERGKEVVQEAKDSAVDTVRERGREETQELASSLRGNSQDDAAPTQSSDPQDRAQGVVGQAG
jgi:ElaB/YqjD/DUF883 family membrane-anchored ribosome-binding protein